jgi:hypothetical protein
MYPAAVNAAREVRLELRRAYPQVKFDIATVGASVFVAWTNGPGRTAVKKIVDRFEVNAQGGNRVIAITSRFSICPRCKSSLFQAEPGDPIRCRICLKLNTARLSA